MKDEERADALRNRGRGMVTTSDKKKYLVQIIQSKCMGAESCVGVAPEVFSLDSKKLDFFGRGDPLQVKEVVAGTVHSETVVRAAKSCPYHAIYVQDTQTGGVEAGELDD